MKLHVVSDLHLDCGDWQFPPTDADVLVAAGDLHDDGEVGARWAVREASRLGKPLLLVPGNHDFLGSCISDRLDAMRRICRGTGVHLLFNRTVQIGPVMFAGTTLWTDFGLHGEPNRILCMQAARDMMGEFTHTFQPGSTPRARISPAYHVRMNARARRFLQRVVDGSFEQPTVIITHHAPSGRSIAPQYQRGHMYPLNAAFANDLDNLIGWSNVRMWIHGHTHSACDYMLGPARVLCNPRGYAGREGNTGFDSTLVVEVPMA